MSSHRTSVVIECLESRAYFNAGPFVYTDSDADQVAITILGPGELRNPGGLSNGGALDVSVHGSTKNTELSIQLRPSSGGDGRVAVESITADSPLHALVADGVVVEGAAGIAVAGSVASLTVSEIRSAVHVNGAVGKIRLDSMSDGAEFTAGKFGSVRLAEQKINPRRDSRFRRVPTVELTHVPALGDTTDQLKGLTRNVATSKYRVAAVVHAYGGYWTKPYWDSPLTVITKSSKFSVNTVTGGVDETADQLSVFVVRADYDVPLLGGETELPRELIENAIARADAYRP